MEIHELEQILFEELGYAGKQGLLQGDAILWSNGRKIEEINAAIFLKNVPIVYFSRFAELDTNQIEKLHKKVWSQSKAPLLFVILPHEIRVYNGYDHPPLTGAGVDT